MLCGRKELNITISFIQQTFVKHIIYSRQWTFKDKYSCPQEFTVQRGGKQGSIQVEYNNTGEHHEVHLQEYRLLSEKNFLKSSRLRYVSVSPLNMPGDECRHLRKLHRVLQTWQMPLTESSVHSVFHVWAGQQIYLACWLLLLAQLSWLPVTELGIRHCESRSHHSHPLVCLYNLRKRPLVPSGIFATSVAN